jgi:energy-converting hydrogenase Eha subunit A
MIGLLQTIVDLFVCWVETGVMTVLNLVIAALGAAIAALALLMPTMPDFPTTPSWLSSTGPTPVLGWIAWFFPVHQLVLMLAFFLSAWLLWFALSIVLRWAKAIG